MRDWLVHLPEQFAGNPILQGLAAAIATFVLEDPTTVTCGLLVAEGRMAFTTALVGLTLGIAIGDLGLYTVGRFVGPTTLSWGLMSQDRLDRAKRWFDRNLVVAVLLSRFLPGTRLPTYVGAGILQASVVRFLGAALVASLMWTYLLLTAAAKIGEAVLPLLGRFKWPVAAAFILLLIIAQRRAAKRLAADPAGNRPPSAPIASAFEFWPPALFYIPVGVYYAWLSLRFRSFTLPTAANPSIYSGGLIRESKSQILSLVPEPHRQWLARYTRFPAREAGGSLEQAVSDALNFIQKAGISFPLVAKPDAGQRGAGVQRLRDTDELREYLRDFPSDKDLMFQELIDLPREVGLLYYRFPGSAEGTIFSVTYKEFPEVIGDGKRPLRELILADPRARLIHHVYFRRHALVLDRILPAGERFPLVFAGNHAQGAVFKDGKHLLTPALLARFDEIARAMPDFYFGRFDVRFDRIDALQRGEGFRIVEINGAGAESTHIWDASTTLPAAYRALFEQFRILFEIGAANRRRGHRPLGPIRVLRDCCWYRRAAREYPISH